MLLDYRLVEGTSHSNIDVLHLACRFGGAGVDGGGPGARPHVLDGRGQRAQDRVLLDGRQQALLIGRRQGTDAGRYTPNTETGPSGCLLYFLEML